VLATALAAALIFCAAAPAAARSHPSRRGGDFTLTATGTGSDYAPTFTGSGLLGVRVPPAGQGYAPGTVPAQSELAGFYAQPPKEVQQRANVPTWSTLAFSDGSKTFDPKAPGTRGWKQTLDLRTGIVTTSATWKAADGHVTDLAYEVLTDRARPNVGLVRLRLTPHWSGTATVDDRIDGRPANINAEGKRGKLSTEVGKGWEAAAASDWVTIAAVGTGIEATLADRLIASGSVAATIRPLEASKPESVGQRLEFPVTAGQTYTLTKFVAVVDSRESPDPAAAAREGAAAAASAGYGALLTENAAAWAKLWRGRIEIRGNETLADDVNASQFYLWSSTGAGIDWSISPAGLSSNGYNGHIFWDAETWMFPSLLAQHPELAEGMNDYRYDRLAAAERHATQTGWSGVRFPWESALDGTEQIPPPVSVNSEGLYEQHIVADVALAQWQYYLATGDREWLRSRGWPVIAGAAEFWASRAKRSGGAFHLDHVTGPDEENPNVKDEVYTNVAAKTVLEDAASAAQAIGQPAPPRWSNIAHDLAVPFDRAEGIHPEFDGYGGQLVKQADATLVQYPWDLPMPRKAALADLDYYVPRSDPGGPSMTDAVSMIDTASLDVPGCSSYVFTRRSYEPFIKDVFDQFSETREGGAFTFMTGIGGFLQEFLYGYSGLRWDPGAVRLDPSLNAQVGTIVLHHLRWRGRVFDLTIDPHHTTVMLESGQPLPVRAASGAMRRISAGRSLTLRTRRPDLTPTHDPLRCTAASTSSAEPGAPALAAVDGSPATQWQAASLPASLTIPLHGAHRLDQATLRWGRAWQPPPKPNVHPPAHPVLTRRATDYVLLGSSDGQRWKRLARISGRANGSVDTLHFPPTSVRFLRLRVTAATKGIEGKEEAPLLEELSAAS
jgi:trehalose/maltose hydrolase-like predicted phosphorylase